MCDDFTDLAQPTPDALTRRGFTAFGAVAALAGVAPALAAPKRKLTERMVAIPTADGSCDALFVHPAKGKAPAVILWPDIGGLREAFYVMARRLADDGYAVLAVNHYYRNGKAPVLASFSEWRTPAGQEKLKPMIAAVNADTNMRDAKAFVAWLDKQKVVDTKRGIGSQGYCMTGSWALRSAVAVPGRVKGVGSFHGGGLVTAAPDSPHLLMAKTQASYLFAIAKNDDARAPTDKDGLKAAAAAAGRPAEVEVYGGDHGWTVPDSPVYNQAEADRAHARLLAVYAKL